MKQTAIELLYKLWYENKGVLTPKDFIEAKEMERQQIIDFANDLLAQNDKNYIAMPDLAEQYYNETFDGQDT